MNNKQKNWTIFFGIITALVVVFTQLFWFQAADFSRKSAKTEQQADASTETEAHISLPSTSLTTPNTIQVEQDFSFIHEILFEKESEKKPAQTLVSVAGKFFHTLFRAIISPNAP
jgi:flagellar basal body-associated protein FliL